MIYRADEIMGTQQTSEADKENSPAKVGRGLFKRKTARRSKSLGKDHWEDVIFCKSKKPFDWFKRLLRKL